MRDKLLDDPERDRVIRRDVSFTEPVINVDRLRLYTEYNRERASIYLKKEILLQPKPWTDNKILQENKFTNVRRELDKESVWLIYNVLKDYTLSLEERALNCFLFRLINAGKSMDAFLGGPVRFDQFTCPEDSYQFSVFKDRANSEISKGAPIQSNAYFLSHTRAASNRAINKLSAESQELVRSNPNGQQVYYTALHRETIIRAFEANSPKEAFNILNSISSIGPFLGYQIWVDWTYMTEYKFSENYFTVSGPGCDDGIDRLCSDKGGRNHTEFLYWFEENLPRLTDEACLDWDPEKMLHFMPEGSRNWGIMQVENSGCEFFKRVRLEEGARMRRRNYNGR